MKSEQNVAEKSVQTSTKGKRSDVQGDPKGNKVKVDHTKKVEFVPVAKRTPLNPEESKKESHLESEQQLIKCDMAHRPEIHPKFASILPVNPASYKARKEQICKGGSVPIFNVCLIEGKTYLLGDQMDMDIVIKNNINNFYIKYEKSVTTVDQGIWWILEKVNSLPHYRTFVLIEINLQQIDIYRKFAKENIKMGGKYKNKTSKAEGFKEKQVLKMIGKKVGYSHQTVNQVRYILDKGTAEIKEECRKGELSIDAADSQLRGKKKKSKKKSKRGKKTEEAPQLLPNWGILTESAENKDIGNKDIMKENGTPPDPQPMLTKIQKAKVQDGAFWLAFYPDRGVFQVIKKGLEQDKISIKLDAYSFKPVKSEEKNIVIFEADRINFSQESLKIYDDADFVNTDEEVANEV